MSETINAVLAWFGEQFQSLKDALNPITYIEQFATFVAGYLPDASPIANQIAVGLNSIIAFAGPFISLLDFIIDVPLTLTAIILCLTIEMGVNIFRVWRTVRSTVT